jgi:DNA-binding beta-propeller fold protein YncE
MTQAIRRSELSVVLALLLTASAGARADTLGLPIDLPGTLTPNDVTMHVSGKRAYATGNGGQASPCPIGTECPPQTLGYLSVINTVTYNLLGSLNVESPGRLASSPDGQWLYVINTAARTLEVYKTLWPDPALAPASPQYQKSIPLSLEPFDVTFSPDSQWAFVTSTSGVVDVIDVASHTRQSPSISVGGDLRGVAAVNVPNRGLQVYIAIADTFPQRIAVIDRPFSSWQVRTVPLPVSFQASTTTLFPAANAAGSKVFLTTPGSRVVVIQTSNDSVSYIDGVGQNLVGIDVTVTAWGERVYVSDLTSVFIPNVGTRWQVHKLDANSHAFLGSIPFAGKHPGALEAAPNGTSVYVTATSPSPTYSRLERIVPTQ